MCYNSHELIGGHDMFRNLLNPNNALMITMAQISDCIFLSLFWLIGCIPVVTVGASTAALYDAVYHAFRKGDKQSWFRFLKTFRENLVPSLAPSVAYLLCFVGLGWLVIQLWNSAVAGVLSWMIFSALAFIAVAVLGVLSVMFPMLSRFENNFGSLVKNTLLLALANLPGTVGLGMVNTACILLCMRYVFPLFFLPALAALIGTLFIEPMFKPYMPVERDEMPLE